MSKNNQTTSSNQINPEKILEENIFPMSVNSDDFKAFKDLFTNSTRNWFTTWPVCCNL